jgi:hypothetical protein
LNSLIRPGCFESNLDITLFYSSSLFDTTLVLTHHFYRRRRPAARQAAAAAADRGSTAPSALGHTSPPPPGTPTAAPIAPHDRGGWPRAPSGAGTTSSACRRSRRTMSRLASAGARCPNRPRKRVFKMGATSSHLPTEHSKSANRFRLTAENCIQLTQLNE